MLNAVERESAPGIRAEMAGSEIATATGFVFVWRSLGQVFGVGLSSAVYQASLARELDNRFDDKTVSRRSRAVITTDHFSPSTCFQSDRHAATVGASHRTSGIWCGPQEHFSVRSRRSFHRLNDLATSASLLGLRHR